MRRLLQGRVRGHRAAGPRRRPGRSADQSRPVRRLHAVRAVLPRGGAGAANNRAATGGAEGMETSTTTAAPVTTLIAGLGGQGVVLAGDVLAEAALQANLNVKKSEVHGLSRRFGSVSCQVRIGRELHSPLKGHGGVDVLLALEGYEALKHLPFLGPGGVALANR